jgi:hypothetical protein
MNNSGRFAFLVGTFTMIFTIGLISLIVVDIYTTSEANTKKNKNIFSNDNKFENVQDTIKQIRGIKNDKRR